jgi:hypothetical protein
MLRARHPAAQLPRLRFGLVSADAGSFALPGRR